MGHAARLALFTSPLSLVFLLTLLVLCSAAPAPAPAPVPDQVFTFFGHPVTIKTPGEGGPFGGGGRGGGGGGGGGDGGFGGGGNPFTKFTIPPNRDPTTTPQKPPSTPTPPAAPPQTTTPPPPPPSSPTKAPAAPPSSPANPNGGQQPSSKSSTHASSTKKSSSHPAFPTGPTIPAGIVTGSSNAGSPTVSPSDPASTSPATANGASSRSFNSKLLAGILIPVILIIFLVVVVATVVVYKRRRDRARAAETPTSQWLGGGGASTGAWSRLDMASRYDLASPAPSPQPHPPSAVVVPGRALDVTEFMGEAVSVSTFSTPPSSSSGHMDVYAYGGTGEGGSELGSGSVLGTPSTAAPTDGHSAPGHGHNASVSASAYASPAYSAAGHTFATGRTDDGHSTRHLAAGPRTDDDHGSIFADSPFESESPLHWQNEPALADSRPTSLDAAAVPPLPPLPSYPAVPGTGGAAASHSLVYDPGNSPTYGLRGSTMLAYDRDSNVPDAFDPRRSELM